MNKYLNTLKKNTFLSYVLTGFAILIPIIGLIYLLRNLVQAIEKQILVIMEKTNLDSAKQVIIAAIGSFIILILLAYLIGYLSKTKVVLQMIKRLDEQLMNASDSYRNLKLKLDNDAQFMLKDKPAIFAKFGECERPGFLMQNADNSGNCVIFIPKDFRRYDGNIYIVPLQNIRFAKGGNDDFIYAMDHLGDGMNIS